MAKIIARIEEWQKSKGRKTKIGQPTMFLRNLHGLLDKAESLVFDRMICWSPDGESFRIFEPWEHGPHYQCFLSTERLEVLPATASDIWFSAIPSWERLLYLQAPSV